MINTHWPEFAVLYGYSFTPLFTVEQCEQGGTKNGSTLGAKSVFLH